MILTLQASPGCLYTDISRRKKSQSVCQLHHLVDLQKEIDKANHLLKKAIEEDLFTKRGKYATYTATERAKIGKYAAENGNTKACGYFFRVWKRKIPESTVRRLKNEYLKELNEKMAGYDEKECVVTCLPTQPRGRPLLVGDYINFHIIQLIRNNC